MNGKKGESKEEENS